MTTETDHTLSTDPGGDWSGYKEPVHEAPLDPRAAPEELSDPEPDEFDLPAVAGEYEDDLAPSDNPQESVAVPSGTAAAGDPLLSPETESDLLDHWSRIQVSFVEDPRASVQDADALVMQIASTFLASFRDRRSQLAAAWQDGQPDTEQLRLALREYRDFVNVVLPR